MRPLVIPEKAWRVPPQRWVLRYKRTDGGWDIRSFRGTVQQAREEARRNLPRYEAVWIVEHEDRKL